MEIVYIKIIDNVINPNDYIIYELKVMNNIIIEQNVFHESIPDVIQEIIPYKVIPCYHNFIGYDINELYESLEK